MLLLAQPAAAARIDPDDILGEASASVPFASQRGYYVQVIGTYPYVAKIPETGIHHSPLPGGDTLRFGKAPDPLDPGRQALVFQVHPDDPLTAGARRAELRFGNNIELDQVYWVAFSVYVQDWGRLSGGDESLFGFQLHTGNDNLNLSPSMSLITRGGRTFWIDARGAIDGAPNTLRAESTRSADYPVPFGRWTDFVVKFKQNVTGAGFMQVWMDGNRVVNYRGSLGFNTPGYKDYFKFGYYNWTRAMNSPRKVLLRGAVVVRDASGSKYQPEDLRAYVAAPR
jgi:hypothetical protein